MNSRTIPTAEWLSVIAAAVLIIGMLRGTLQFPSAQLSNYRFAQSHRGLRENLDFRDTKPATHPLRACQ